MASQSSATASGAHRGDQLAHGFPRRPQLTVLALLVLGGAVAFLGLGGPPTAGWGRPALLGALGLMGLGSVGLLAADRLLSLPLARLTQLGLAFGVLIAGCIAMAAATYNWAPAGIRGGVSPVAVWVLVFPLLVRAPTRPALIAAIIAAATDPLAALVLGSGWPAPGPAVLWLLTHVGAVAACLLPTDMRLPAEADDSDGDIGHYKLVELLAEGGMGEVWLAEHQLLGRPAAIKLIRPVTADGPDLDQTLLLKRFEREVRATAKLTSPHTVQIYDFGTVGDGSFYYAMELLDGFDLFTLVAKWGPQPPERVVLIMRQACESLYEAHEAGLVHRDIKPGNLLICRWSDRLDFVKVVDFGFVSQRDESAPATRLTKHGVAPGTPAFMAPEIARGRRDFDGRADLYSLACVAYWLLTARVVFEEPTPTKMLLAHVKEPPLPPSARTEHTIPEELDTIILDCLAKPPEARPQTALELASRLERLDIEKYWTADRKAQWWAEAKAKTDT